MTDGREQDATGSKGPQDADERPFGEQLYEAMRAEFKAIPFGLTYAEIQEFKRSDREALAKRMRSRSYAAIQRMRSSSIEEIVAEARLQIERREQAAQAGASLMMLSSFIFS